MRLPICGADFFFGNLHLISSFFILILNRNGRKFSLCNVFKNDKSSRGRKNKLEHRTLAMPGVERKTGVLEAESNE